MIKYLAAAALFFFINTSAYTSSREDHKYREELCERIINEKSKNKKPIIYKLLTFPLTISDIEPISLLIMSSRIYKNIDEQITKSKREDTIKLIESDLNISELQIIFNTISHNLVSSCIEASSLAIIKIAEQIIKPLAKNMHLKRVRPLKITEAERKLLLKSSYHKDIKALERHYHYLNARDIRNLYNLMENSIISLIREKLSNGQIIKVESLISTNEYSKFEKAMQTESENIYIVLVELYNNLKVLDIIIK